MNRFAARYRVAAGFEGMDCQYLGNASVRGYTTGLRVTLAFSALEALEYAVSRRMKSRFEILDGALAEELRGPSLKKMRILLQRDEQLRPGLKGRIETLLTDRKSRDVRPAAERLRHLFAHGQFTPRAAGMDSSKRVVAWGDGLAVATLATADREFTKWVEMTGRSSRSP